MNRRDKFALFYIIVGSSLLVIYSIVLGGFVNAIDIVWHHLLHDLDELDVHMFIAGLILVLYGGDQNICGLCLS